MTAPTSKAGMRRFLADYQSSTRYRVWVKVKGSWEPCSWLPTYPTMTEAELAAAKIAMPTDIRAERSGENGAGAAIRKDADSVRAETSTPSPLPQPVLFCQCGHPEDEHYEGSVCMKIEGMYVCGCEHFVQEAA